MSAVRRVKPLYLLLALAVVAPLLAFWPKAQGGETDWPKEIERACTASRYGLRLSAARKVATGGAAAIPALRAHEALVGRAALPSSLVEAIADHDDAAPAVLDLLLEWVGDRDFYWRGQAMRGLANRAGSAPRKRIESVFAAHADDPAWLTRTHARFGLALLGGNEELAELCARLEADPRARVRLLSLLLGKGLVPPLQGLIDALAEERTFLGDPWGKRIAQEAAKALRTWLGADVPAELAPAGEDKEGAMRYLAQAAANKSGQSLHAVPLRTDGTGTYLGGLQILSCKHGDQFVRWGANGQVHFGLGEAAEPGHDLGSAGWTDWWAERERLGLEQRHGEVICDSLQLLWQQPSFAAKIAPAALPAAAAEWLTRWTAMVEQTDAVRAQAIRLSLSQFAPR